jgi:hypothetical protein
MSEIFQECFDFMEIYEFFVCFHNFSINILVILTFIVCRMFMLFISLYSDHRVFVQSCKFHNFFNCEIGVWDRIAHLCIIHILLSGEVYQVYLGYKYYVRRCLALNIRKQVRNQPIVERKNSHYHKEQPKPVFYPWVQRWCWT